MADFTLRRMEPAARYSRLLQLPRLYLPSTPHLQGTYQTLLCTLSAVLWLIKQQGTPEAKAGVKTSYPAVFDKHVGKCMGSDEDVCLTLPKDDCQITYMYLPLARRALTPRPLMMGHVGVRRSPRHRACIRFRRCLHFFRQTCRLWQRFLLWSLSCARSLLPYMRTPEKRHTAAPASQHSAWHVPCIRDVAPMTGSNGPCTPLP